MNLALSTDLNEASENHNLNERSTVISAGLPGEGGGGDGSRDTTRHLEIQEGILETVDSESGRERVESEELDVENSSESKLSSKCPLCRGAILGWEVVEEARKYLNLKKRSCSRESCSFFGNYQESRRHVKRVHPTTLPSDIDPN